MLNKLIVATALVFSVLYFGDPYAPENKGRLPYLPPAADDATIAELKEHSASFLENIDMEGTYQSIANHELTHDMLELLSGLKSSVFRYILEHSEDNELVAQAD